MEENKNLNLSDLETLVYDYIVKQNAYYANINIQVRATQSIIEMLAEKEKEQLIKFSYEIEETINKKFPISGYLTYNNPLCSLSNDIGNRIHYVTCSQGCWTTYPLEGKGCLITYENIMSTLGLSKDVAKKGVDSLLKKEIISRKKSYGGYEYLAKKNDIAKKMIENKGDFKPRTFNQNTFFFEVDDSLCVLFTQAQPNYDSFQDYYEKLALEEAKEHIND